MSAEWRWVSTQALILLHDESLAEHGGSPGIRDPGLLDSAMARPLNLAAYSEPDAAELAASYGFGLAQNHPFVDGNKRAAFLAIGLFLGLNGKRLVTTQLDATETILALAAGELDERGLAEWIRAKLIDRL
jgi:death-on-curing protein